MKTLKANQFNFYMSDIQEVQSLENGALEHGGATKTASGIYSNIENSDMIQVYEGHNEVAIYIPSTLDTDQATDSTEYIEKYLYSIQAHYPSQAVAMTATQGSWYSDKTNEVVIEDITILSMNLEDITQIDLDNMQVIAEQVKRDMSQDAVSITFNGSLALV